MIIKFTARWCSSCLLTNKAFYSLVKDYKNFDTEISFMEIDVDSQGKDNINFMEKYKVNNQTVLPIMIFLDESGQEYNRIKGEKNRAELIEIIDKHLEVNNRSSPSFKFNQPKQNFISNLASIFKK